MRFDTNEDLRKIPSFFRYSRVIIFTVFFGYIVQLALAGTGKIRVNLPGVELSDYRFGLGEPYVVFYERDSYRGGVHFQRLSRKCQNLPDAKQNWASSVDVQKRCINVCDGLDCTGNCMKIYAHPEDPNNKGAPKLSKYGFNDKVKSVKFCYP